MLSLTIGVVSGIYVVSYVRNYVVIICVGCDVWCVVCMCVVTIVDICVIVVCCVVYDVVIVIVCLFLIYLYVSVLLSLRYTLTNMCILVILMR